MSDWKNDRPPGWEEIVDARIKKVNDSPIIHIGIRDNFEAGADAILGALKGNKELHRLETTKGFWVFIPEESK